MLHKTRGIVFHQIKYAETSVIVKIYTEKFGIQSFLVKGIHQKKSKIKSSFFQPLTLLDMVIYHKENREINHIKEIKIAQTLQTIPFDIRKSTIVIFLNEILLKSIKEQEANPELFDFIYRGIVGLDNTSNRIADFHLFFTIHLTKYLGFFPRDNYDDSHTIFDMQEGIYQDSSFGLKYYIGEKLNLFWHKLHTENFENAGPLQINALQRQELLQKINDYYSIHLPAFKNIKSMQVLSEVLK